LSKPLVVRGSVCALCVVTVIIAIASFMVLAGPRRHATAPPAAASQIAAQSRVRSSYASLPLAFEENKGQTDPQVKYLARGEGYTLFLTDRDVVFSLRSAKKSDGVSSMPGLNRAAREESTAVVRMTLANAYAAAKLSAGEMLPGKSNYLIGRDSSKWQTGVVHYGRVNYQNVYPGVNLAFHGAQRQTEFDFVLAAGADPTPIAFQFTGSQAMKTDDSGNLEIATGAGNVVLHKPFAYQERNGARQPVEAKFILEANNRVTFALGNYDRSRELVIDPSVAIEYSTYLGGSNNDSAYGIAFDSSGNAYVTGQTSSTNFPGYTSTNKLKGVINAFVSKISANGSTLVYSTYVGGSQSDSGNAIAVDASGDAFVAGGTSSSDFPVTAGVFQGTCGSCTSGNFNAFVFELGSTGSALTYSTFLGGSASDLAFGIALASDGSGDVYVGGEASSQNFPTLNPLQGNVAGTDGFLTKLNSSGSALAFSTYLGGSATGDAVLGVAVDPSNNVYATGQTYSSTFPTKNAYQPTCKTCTSSASSAFVTEINPTGLAYEYSTFLGGSTFDAATGIAVDSTGSAYVTGKTQSSDFPTTPGAYQTKFSGTTNDAFVTKLSAGGSALGFSTFLGGSGTNLGAAIAIDGSDNVYVTGETSSSSDFPTASPTQSAYGGGDSDAFVSEINSSGTQLVFSTYVGGPGDEDTLGQGAIAVDTLGANIYVTGDTEPPSGGGANTFPTTSGSVQPSPGGDDDAFVVKYSQPVTPSFTLAATTPAAVAPGTSATSTITLTSNNGYNSAVNLTCSVSGGGTPAPACSASSFSTNPVTPTAGGVQSTLTVTTTGPSSALSRPARIFYAMWLPLAGVCLAGFGFGSPRSRRNKLLSSFLLLMVISALLVFPACGGSSNNGGGGGGGGGTPAGSYTVTITGTDANNLTQSTQVTLVVN
jgi:Beta-propeller repeat